ncbi:MAG: WbqC family protein [Saprospiraceae bacterium]|nr:WbqC family protein [Saprospiraceae bacterium]
MIEQPLLIELHYLPNIQFFSKLYLYQNVCIEQHENYLKGSYRNRAHIAGSNGLLRLSIPLQKGKNEQQGIQEVRIAYHEPWQQQHWASIQSAYGNAPFYEFYADAFEPLYQQQFEYLFEWNKALLETILSFLEYPASLTYSSAFRQIGQAGPYTDFSNGIFPKKHRQKEDAHFEPQPYPQVFSERNGFLPNLSILDLLFCTGPQASIILEQSVI